MFVNLARLLQSLRHPHHHVFHRSPLLDAGQGYQTLRQDRQTTGAFNMVQPLLLHSALWEDGDPTFLEARLLGHFHSLVNPFGMLALFLDQSMARELKNIKFSFSPMG